MTYCDADTVRELTVAAAVHESGCGPSRHFAASQQFGRFRSEADINERFAERTYEYAP